MAVNISGIRIDREGDAVNATGCTDNVDSDTYHVVVYDIEADGTVDWRSRALFVTASLNLTSSLAEWNTGKVYINGCVRTYIFFFLFFFFYKSFCM